MNGNSVIATEYKIFGGSKVVNLNNREEPFSTRIYDYDYVSRKSSTYKDSRRFLEVDWQKSFELHGFKLDWKESMSKRIDSDVYNMKRDLKFPTNESYTKAVEMGHETMVNHYLLHLEKSLEEISGLKAPAKKAPAKKSNTKKEASIDELNNSTNE